MNNICNFVYFTFLALISEAYEMLFFPRWNQKLKAGLECPFNAACVKTFLTLCIGGCVFKTIIILIFNTMYQSVNYTTTTT